LLSPTDRSRAGYRLYDDEAIQRLEFIRAAQAVGFTLDDIRALLELNGDSPCKQVQALIERRLAEVDEKLADLQRVRSTLADAFERCRTSNKGCAVVADLKRKRE
jgi:MerR family mercuric resistance operon transcriptional regulator